MSTINLIVGGLDVSEWVETESYSCHCKDIIPIKFTCYDGSEFAERSGYQYELGVEFKALPEDTAAALMQKLNSITSTESVQGTLAITFTDLLSEAGTTTAYFTRPPDLGGSIAYELDGIDYWDISLSLTSTVIAVSGSL